ncbi:MAG TPA: hypothetical protein VL026_04265 [Rhizomicrobium sp.]|nr:hypothetical protein [Rhizomicrobium sp.]
MTLKMILTTASAAAMALSLSAIAASAQPATVSSTGNVCLKTIQIDRTEVPNESTILFHMKDGKTWENKLRGGPCVGLRFNGFVYVSTPPNQICGNLQTIRAIQTGSVCMLGPFTPYVKKDASQSDEAADPAADHAGH